MDEFERCKFMNSNPRPQWDQNTVPWLVMSFPSLQSLNKVPQTNAVVLSEEIRSTRPPPPLSCVAFSPFPAKQQRSGSNLTRFVVRADVLRRGPASCELV